MMLDLPERAAALLVPHTTVALAHLHVARRSCGTAALAVLLASLGYRLSVIGYVPK